MLLVASAGAPQERLHERVQFVDPADVLDVGVHLVAQAHVQREPGARASRSARSREMVVVRIVDHEALVGLAAPQRDGEQQVAVVDDAVAVVIEGRRSPGRARCARRGTRRGRSARARAATRPRIAAGAPRTSDSVFDNWNRRLVGALRHAERRAVLQARKGQLRPGDDRLDAVVETAEEADVFSARRQDRVQVPRTEWWRFSTAAAARPSRSRDRGCSRTCRPPLPE
jgi:hypothetical protein